MSTESTPNAAPVHRPCSPTLQEIIGQILDATEKIRDLCKGGKGWRLGDIDREALAIENTIEGRVCGNCGSISAVCVGPDMNEADTYCCRECCQIVHHDECAPL